MIYQTQRYTIYRRLTHFADLIATLKRIDLIVDCPIDANKNLSGCK